MSKSTKIATYASVAYSIFAMSTPTPALAGNITPWAQTIIKMIDAPIIDTLNIYRTDGFVLLDVGNNYAAYAPTARRLTESQRANASTVEADSDFVISFISCGSSETMLGGKIDNVAISAKISDTDQLAEELRELIIFSRTSLPNIKPGEFGASSIKEDQVFMGWTDGAKTAVEIQISRNPHQLVWRANRLCD